MESVATRTDADARTRDRVRDAVAARGPVSAADLAADLGVTPAAVRRHLDALGAAGLVAARQAGPPDPRSPRGRGRPARTYVLTPAGHRAAPSAYDDLATSALAHLEAVAGRAAVAGFARARVAELEERYAPVVAAAGADVPARARALAGALAGDGYAASAGTTRGGAVQLCQGHCPVHAVAARYPELCDAEAQAFARLLGTPVRRLATLAAGSHACTTHVSTPVPTTRSTTSSTTRSTTSTSHHGEDPQ